jgi:hypothetical protein
MGDGRWSGGLPAISHHSSLPRSSRHFSPQVFPPKQWHVFPPLFRNTTGTNSSYHIQGWCVECSRSKKAPWDFRRNFGQHPLDFVNSAGPSPTCLHSTPTIVHRTPTLHPYRYSIQSIRSNPPQPSFILRLLPLTTLRPRCLFPFFLSPSAFQLISVLTVSWENRI